jgi:hypothetical protein
MLDISQIFDGTFSTTTNVPSGAAITVSRNSTNVLDFLVARDMGAGGILGVHVLVTEAFATLTSLDIEYQVSADNVTFATLLAEKTIPVAQLIAGSPIFRYNVPRNQYANSTAGVLGAPGRYHRLKYTVNGANATAGKVIAWLNPADDRNDQYAYPSNFVS